MLQASDISVQFGGIRALDQVSLDLNQGEIVGLIGPNGAGKSTLVNVLSGFQEPSSGTIRLDGGDITSDAAYVRARRRIARTFQAVRLFPNMTVAENIALPAIATGVPKHMAFALAEDLADWLAIRDLSGRTGHELSYSDERKVSIARALALKPRFLLMDEPAAGMSEGDGRFLVERIRGMAATFGCGVLLIEHNVNLVVSACDRISVLNFGRTLAAGLPDAILNDTSVVGAYLGTEH